MRDVVYEVTAHISSPELKEAYLDWLGRGHVQGVLSGGARHAMVTVYEDSGGWAVESRYVFSSPQDFEVYEAGAAVALRATTEERFGGVEGIWFDRKMGMLAFRLP